MPVSQRHRDSNEEEQLQGEDQPQHAAESLQWRLLSRDLERESPYWRLRQQLSSRIDPLAPLELQTNEPCPVQPAELDAVLGLDSMVTDSDEDEEYSEDFTPPVQCFFLNQGQAYQGRQRVAHSGLSHEHWGVGVRIQHVDLRKGYVCGTMTTTEVPLQSRTPIVTFWEGEIIDNANHCFLTSKWHAAKEVDMAHWARFEGFAPIRKQVDRQYGRCGGLTDYPYIFMRWKEQFYVSCPDQCRLTIQGFYYVCLNRETGAIEGFYYDRRSSPYQKLELQPCGSSTNLGGINSAAYELC